MNKELYKPIEEKMNKTIHVLKNNLAGIRAGRANPAILDKLSIEYYCKCFYTRSKSYTYSAMGSKAS